MTLRGSFLTATLAVVSLNVPTVWAQGKRAGVNRKMPERPARPNLHEVERIEKMPPEQRRAELAKLPTERRQQMEQRLERLSKLTPETSAALNNRYAKVKHPHP